MSRSTFLTAVAAGLTLAACSAAPEPDELGASSKALSRAELGELATSPSSVASELITPVRDVRLREDRLDRIRWPWPLEPAEPTTPENTPKSTEPACSRTALWISPGKDVGCPGIEGTQTGKWEPRRVYGDDAPELLATVCAYDWRSDNTDGEPELEVLTQRLGEWDVLPPELDCTVMSSLGPTDAELDDELWRSMRDTAHQQAGRGRGAPKFKSQTLVAVIDSAARPFDETTERDTYGHGRLVGRLIHDLNHFKDSEQSASLIHNELALALDHKGNRNDTHGGHFGTREDLGKAIQRAVSVYAKRLADDRDNAPQRLLLNVSVGWDPKHGGVVDHPSQLTPAARTVYNALARAACLGAITIAAAGNTHGTSDSGPVLPAAWQSLPGPTEDECAQLTGYPEDKFVRRKRLPSSVGDRSFPLVIAASAVDDLDHPLATTRSGAAPRTVAYGLSVVTDDVGGARGDHTNTQTGSSFAAAVTSAAAAGVWAIAPELTPRDVVDVVYKSGIPLGIAATMPTLGAIDEQHRVSVCEAMLAASCWTGSCDVDIACDTSSARGGSALWTGELFDRSTDVPLTSGVGAVPALDSALIKPWTCGQPLDDNCHKCSLRRISRDLTISLAASSVAATTNVYVVTGGISYLITPPSPGAYPSSFTTTLPPGVLVDRATLVRDLVSGGQLSEDIIVLDE
jgi:hypothetical protein